MNYKKNKTHLYPKSFKDMNKEFQYLWNKFGRDDWQVENLGDYCANLEYMIMNYLDRNKKLGPIVSTASKKENLDIRPEVIYKNYDYGQQTKSEKENTKLGPGSGLYENLDKYKSVKDFVDTDRKMKRKQRKSDLNSILDSLLKSQTDEVVEKNANYLDVLDSYLDSFASGIIGDVEIPEEVLEKIKEDKLEDEESKKSKEEPEKITQDNTITGTPFANTIDAGPSYDELLTYPNGALFDNDVTRNSYYGIYSLQGSSIDKAIKIADIYYNLAISSNNEIY